MPRFRVLTAAVAAITGVGLAIAPADAAPSPAPPGGFSAKTIAQIDALARAKSARTPTQQKVDSRLLTEIAQRAGRTAAPGVGRLKTGVRIDKHGLTPVTVRGAAKAAADQVRAYGGRVLGVYSRDGAVRADVPLPAVEKIAASLSVTRVEIADQYVLADADDVNTSSAQRERALRGTDLAGALAAPPVGGSVTSQGDVTHAADQARARFKVTGTGVKVAVLSDGVDSLAQAIASGDLPPDVEVLPGEAGAGDEGTAMLEIIHDLAPNARLAFATVGTSDPLEMAANIRALRAAGADIIVDDVIYLNESPFQDGPIAQAVIDVTNNGALYFSSAGNEQNVDDHTGGNWEGDYVSSGQAIGKYGGFAHDFKPGPGVQVLDPVSMGSWGVPAILQWNDRLGHSQNDYDLYAVDKNGNVLDFSNDVQNGNDDPIEGLGIPPGTLGLAVVKFKGVDRYFQLTPFGGLFQNRAGLTGYATPGVTRGHSAVPAAFSVAAAPAAKAFGRPIAPGVVNPAGPFPGVFTKSQQSEVFTSDGPRRVFYYPDGRAITPGNLTSTGGQVRLKPDITAADGVSTSLADFTPFFGTSAAAPHAAAIAALVLSGNLHTITLAQVRAALTGTAIDIEKPGYDRDTGYGIVMATRVLQATGVASRQPWAVAGQPQVTPVSGDGDAFLERGESADVAIPVTNRGDGPATGVRVQVSSTSPGVTITPSSVGYGTIVVGQTKLGAPFRLTLPANWGLGVSVGLDVRVSFAVGVLSPTTAHFAIPTGQPTATPVTVAYKGNPVAIPDYDPDGVTIPLTATGVGPLSRVIFSIDGSTCTTDVGATTVGIDHTYTSDLHGQLTAPDGTVVELFNGIDSSGNNVCKTVFDDTAVKSIDDATDQDAPYTGNWRPVEPLSALHVHSGDGNWTFTVIDAAPEDTGSVRAFSLHLWGYVS